MSPDGERVVVTDEDGGVTLTAEFRLEKPVPKRWTPRFTLWRPGN